MIEYLSGRYKRWRKFNQTIAELEGLNDRELADLGIARIYIGTRAVGVDLAERNAERIGREVLPLVRGE